VVTVDGWYSTHQVCEVLDASPATGTETTSPVVATLVVDAGGVVDAVVPEVPRLPHKLPQIPGISPS